MQDLSARGVGPRGLAGQGAQVGTTIAAPAAAQNVVDDTGRHEGPEGNRHLGDLPRLTSGTGRVARG